MVFDAICSAVIVPAAISFAVIAWAISSSVDIDLLAILSAVMLPASISRAVILCAWMAPLPTLPFASARAVTDPVFRSYPAMPLLTLIFPNDALAYRFMMASQV